MFDIIFISNGEENADQNYSNLLDRFPIAKRVDRVVGIHNAHKKAATLSLTKMFWVVDADADIVPSFDFTFNSAYKELDFDTVYTYRSINPVNDLIYGYGGIKLLPKKKVLDMDMNSVDMTTSISNKFVPLPEISNTTRFNIDEFSAWKSGFRECAKLASKVIEKQNDKETELRLNVWCSDKFKDRKFGKQTIDGAKAGRSYAFNNSDSLSKINDFGWLYEQFSKYTLG